MRPNPFGVERWFAKYEFTAALNIAESCIKPLTVAEIEDITGVDLRSMLVDMPLGYSEGSGDSRLRRAIAGLYEDTGPVSPDNEILVTVGAIEANYLALSAEIEPGDSVICVHPSYQQLHEIPAALGAKVKKWILRKENGFVPDLDELESLIDRDTKLIVINFPHNPSGSVLEPDSLRRLCQIAADRGITIHSDEVYRGLRLDGGSPSPSAREYMPSATVVGSSSKAFGLSGARIGWIVGPAELIRRCAEHRDYVSICPPRPSEVIATAVFENAGKILERNRRIAAENYRTLMDWASDNSEFFGLVPPREGVVAFPWFKKPCSSEEFCTRLVETKDVLLIPGSRFDAEGHFRIGFGYSHEKLSEGLDRLGRFARSFFKAG